MININRIVFINLFVFLALIIVEISVTTGSWWVIIFSAAGLLVNVHLYRNILGEDKETDQGTDKKIEILDDLDKELKRRKKEDNFLRN